MAVSGRLLVVPVDIGTVIPKYRLGRYSLRELVLRLKEDSGNAWADV
jgi:hypothetical protein